MCWVPRGPCFPGEAGQKGFKFQKQRLEGIWHPCGAVVKQRGVRRKPNSWGSLLLLGSRVLMNNVLGHAGTWSK